jgi:hypothetical protein
VIKSHKKLRPAVERQGIEANADTAPFLILEGHCIPQITYTACLTKADA